MIENQQLISDTAETVDDAPDKVEKGDREDSPERAEVVFYDAEQFVTGPEGDRREERAEAEDDEPADSAAKFNKPRGHRILLIQLLRRRFSHTRVDVCSSGAGVGSATLVTVEVRA